MPNDSDDWMNPKPKFDPRGELCTKAQIAQIFGKTLYWVDGCLKRGAPYEVKGDTNTPWGIRAGDFLRWLQAEAEGETQPTTRDAAYREASRRRTLAAAIAVERDNAEKAAQLVTREQASQVLAENRAIVSEHLLKVPGGVAAKVREARALGPVDAPAMERIVEDEINQAMEGLANKAR
jgi:phage terminase Nu1 subunit (DNA packaging protein)